MRARDARIAPASQGISTGGAAGVVAMAASAGGLPALTAVLASLEEDFPAAVVVVQHIAPDRDSAMPELLARRTPLVVGKAMHGLWLYGGHVYVAPPDRHVLVDAQARLQLSAKERVQHVRPSADVLFESLARSLGRRAAAVVLSGTGRDGADGCIAIHEHGGRVIVQDGAAEFQGMPRAAELTGKADVVLPLEKIALELTRWARQLQVT